MKIYKGEKFQDFGLIEIFLACQTVDECLIAGQVYIQCMSDQGKKSIALENLRWGFIAGGRFTDRMPCEGVWNKAVKKLLGKDL